MAKKGALSRLLVKSSDRSHLINKELHVALGTFPAYGPLHKRYPETLALYRGAF